MPFHAIAKEEIERFGGALDKFIGDAAMGVFGAPVAHEDDAERAVRAALAIQARTAEMAIPVRAAVNTGEAVVTFATGPQVGENVAGDVVNTASRLQSRGAARWRRGRRVDVPGDTRRRPVPRARAGHREGQGGAVARLGRGCPARGRAGSRRRGRDAVRRPRGGTEPLEGAPRPDATGVLAAAGDDRRRPRHRQDAPGRGPPRSRPRRRCADDVVPRALPPLRRVRDVRAARGGRPRGDGGEAIGRPGGSGGEARSASPFALAPRGGRRSAARAARAAAGTGRRRGPSGREPRGVVRRVDGVPRGRGGEGPDRPRDRGPPLGGPVDAGLPGPARRAPPGRAAAARGDGAAGAVRRPARLGRREAELVDRDALAAHRGRHAAAARRAAGAVRGAARSAGAARGERRRQPAVRAGVRADARGSGDDRRRLVDRPARRRSTG